MSKSFGFLSRLSLQDKINFTRHLSIVIKAGLPLVEGLKVIKNQTLSAVLKKIIEEVIIDVENGRTLANSLARYPKIFDDFFINIIQVGEASGTLAANLLYLADEMKKAHTLRSKIRSALIYPIVILIATVGVTALLTFFIFPKIMPVFTSLRINLPLSTKILIATLNFLLRYGYFVLGGLILFIIILRLLMRIAAVRYFFDHLLFFIPLVRTLIIDVNMANFTRILRILLRSGIKIVEAVDITGKTFNNLVYRREFLKAAESVKMGEQFAGYLEKKRNIFPPLLSGMIGIGENTGNLEQNLDYLAEYYTEETENLVQNLTALLEPLLLLIMGLVVGFVAVSIITPIYAITQNIHP